MNKFDKAVREMSYALSKTDDADLIEDFLSSLLTEYELDEVGKRWALVKLIDEGMSQRNISKELGLSLCKITRGSKELKKPNSSFKKMIATSRGRNN